MKEGSTFDFFAYPKVVQASGNKGMLLSFERRPVFGFLSKERAVVRPERNCHANSRIYLGLEFVIAWSAVTASLLGGCLCFNTHHHG